MPRIYLDHAATTPLDPRVLEAMLPFLSSIHGNPSSLHWEGREARKGLDRARGRVAEVLGASPREIVFTSGGSESDALAIRGVVEAAAGRPHVVTSSVEHHAVLHTVQALERAGRLEVTYLPVGSDGLVRVADVESAVRPETVLLSVMYANNETGAVQPLAEVARAARRRSPGIVMHSDAVQAAGWLDLDVDRLGVDLLSLTAHKIYGPRGAGMLYVRTGVRLAPIIHGGGQERGRRAGTEHVSGAVGLAEALRIATQQRDADTRRCGALRDRLRERLRERIPDVRINGPQEPRHLLPGTLNCSIPDVESEALLQYLDLNGIAASSGAACTTGSLEPSHVLLAMGLPEPLARNSLRLTLGRSTTLDEVERVAETIISFAARVRRQPAPAR